MHSYADGDKLCRMQENSPKWKNFETTSEIYLRKRRAHLMSNNGKMSEGWLRILICTLCILPCFEIHNFVLVFFSYSNENNQIKNAM